MIQCDHFYDPQPGSDGRGRHNARVTDRHEVNATFATMDEIRTSMAATWNGLFPDEPTPADGSDFVFTDVEPY